MKKVIWILCAGVIAVATPGFASQPGQAHKTVLSQSGQSDACKHAPGTHKKGCLQNSNVPKEAQSETQQRREPTEQRNFHR